MPQVYRFQDPNEDPRLKQFFASFGITESMNKSIEEGKPWGLFYWPTTQDRKEMVFEYHRKMNPSTYIMNIKDIYRVFDPRYKKESLYWYGSKQVRTPPPAETLPGKEFSVDNYFDRHVKPVVKFQGTDYYGKPVGVELTDTESVYDVDWSPEAFKALIGNPNSKFTNYDLYVGTATAAATKGPPAPMYLIKSEDDFLNGSIEELLEFGSHEFDSLDQFRLTKELQAEEKKTWIKAGRTTTTSKQVDLTNKIEKKV